VIVKPDLTHRNHPRSGAPLLDRPLEGGAQRIRLVWVHTQRSYDSPRPVLDKRNRYIEIVTPSRRCQHTSNPAIFGPLEDRKNLLWFEHAQVRVRVDPNGVFIHGGDSNPNVRPAD
jgi:hypothetical protein